MPRKRKELLVSFETAAAAEALEAAPAAAADTPEPSAEGPAERPASPRRSRAKAAAEAVASVKEAEGAPARAKRPKSVSAAKDEAGNSLAAETPEAAPAEVIPEATPQAASDEELHAAMILEASNALTTNASDIAKADPNPSTETPEMTSEEPAAQQPVLAEAAGDTAPPSTDEEHAAVNTAPQPPVLQVLGSSLKKKQRNETHDKDRVFIRKDLKLRLDALAENRSKGFKTLLLNYGLEKALDELEQIQANQESSES